MAPAVESPGTPDVDEEKQRLRQELAALLGIDSRATAEEATFWKEVGLRYQTADPTASPAQLAILVLSKLGASEEDASDFKEDDGQSVGLGAYEWLLSYLSRGEHPDQRSAEDEEDEEESGSLARENQILVANQDNPIQTIVQFIEDGTIVLDPDWQRGYVWKPRQKRRFIESIFLNLPIPPVLLFQDSVDKKLYVIDGRQRLETVWRFRLGSKKRKESFRTFGPRQQGWQPGDKLNPAANKHFDKLPEEMQRHYNTFVIPARVFMNLPRRTLYEVFRRYNTGSEKLRPAEIRKAVYQGAPLHEMMFELAGEAGVDAVKDPRQRELARQLEGAMRNKKARYGAYNFVGRCLAFAHVGEELSVANCINKFMDDFAKHDAEKFRHEFIEAFEATRDWYSKHNPLSVEDEKGHVAFHEWIATIQIVSTIKLQEEIRAGRTTADAVKAVIDKEWDPFINGVWNQEAKMVVGGVLKEKQNTTTHWGKQREWVLKLRTGVGLPADQPVAPGPP